MIALIDGDMLVYQAAYVSQTKVDFEDGEGETVLVDPDSAVQNAMKLVRSWTKGAGCSSSIICLSAVESDSFRHRLWPGYKGTRTTPKPEAYEPIRKAIEFEFEVYQEDNLEADDLMGIAGTSGRTQAVIVSKDKDMLSVPALVFNPAKHKRPIRISQAQADYNWMRQAMIGDAVDNYPGIPGVGPVNAEAILAAPFRIRQVTETVGKRKPKQVTKWVRGEPCSLWQSMVDHAGKAGITETDLIRQAQLARILRSGDFNKETRTVRLWRPDGQREELTL